MHQSTATQPLKILVVTEDRALQRQLSHFFDMIGYQVLQAAEPRSALAAVEGESPHIVLLGSELAARADWELCRLLSERQPAGEAFTFLMVEDPDESQLQEALEAGVDDFLLKPIGYGELLSRLRAAARVLEYDRRARQQERFESPTGLRSRSALVGYLRGQLTEHTAAPPRVVCVVANVDFFDRINHLQGVAAGNELLGAVAQVLNQLCVEPGVLGSLGTDHFCAILPGADEAAAVEWAEHARQAFSSAEFKLGETPVHITASFGIAANLPTDSAEQLIDRATQAVQSAKASGRNCVVRFGQFAAETQDLTAPGKLFERTVARDVMTPCTVFLQPSEPVGQAVELLHRTRLDGIPVVDADGKLLGLCEQEHVVTVAESDYGTRLVRDLMTTDVQSFGEQENLATLLDFLARDPRSLVVVENEGRPVGFVSSNSFLAMSQRVTTGTFAAESEYSDTSDYLLVPDLCPLECEHTA